MRVIHTIITMMISGIALSAQPSTQHLDSMILAYNIGMEPGMSVGVLKDNELFYSKQVGLSNMEYQIPIDLDTRFSIASITKQFTAACIGVLVHQGLLNVDDDVRKYIPELPDYGKEINIRHLMNHTSGLRNHNVLLDLQGFDYDHTGYTNESIQTLIFRQQGVNNKPGDKFLYANSNYVLLALIIERISGQSIAEFAQKELSEPLNLPNTFYQSSLYEIIENPAYSYYKRGGTLVQHKSVTLCVGAGRLISTVPDLLEWSKIFIYKDHPMSWLGEFLSTQDMMTDGTISNYGRGVFIDAYSGVRTIHHGGRGMGTRTHMLIIPELQLTVVVLANSGSINAEEIMYKVADQFIEPSNSQATRSEPYVHSSSEIKQFLGDYQELNSDLGMKIFLENDTLRAKSSFGGPGVPLTSVSKNLYQRFDNPSVRHKFFPEGLANWDMTVDFGGAAFYFERVTLIDPAKVDLTAYTGQYYSEELDVRYVVGVEDNNLMLQIPNNPKFGIKPGQEDEFGSGRRTRYSFFRNENGDVEGFFVASEGTVKDIKFTLEQGSESL